MRKTEQSGFTLVEVMLAATLTTVVIGGAMVSLSAMLGAYKHLTTGTDHADTARFIFERVKKDLAATFYSPHEANTRFVSEDLTSNGLPMDRLTFISTVNRAVETGQGSSDMAEIQYYIDRDENTPERWLQRRYDFTPDLDPFTGGANALLGRHVISMDFMFYDGEIWWTQWDTVEEIPMMVYVALGFFSAEELNHEPTPEDIENYSTYITLMHYRAPPSDSLGPLGGTESLYQEEQQP